MGARVPDWPEPKAELLHGVVSAFRRRSKAVKHSLLRWDMSLETDDSLERLNVDTFCLHDIRLSVWADGQMWIRVCKGDKNGWELNYSFYLDLNDNDPATVVRRFEETHAYSGNQSDVKKIWEDFNPQE